MTKDYTEYSSLDFAEDPSFIRWALEGDPGESSKWESLVDEHPQLKERIEEAKVLLRSFRFDDAEPSSSQVDALWGRIESSTAHTPGVRRLYWGLAAAAAVVLALIIYVQVSGQVNVRASTGDRLTQVLPDNSTVYVNAGSLLKYPKNFTENRTVRLNGEAFFEVEPSDKPFVIRTNSGDVEVLGTSFNVYARPDGFRIACKSGRVRVTLSGEGQEAELTAGVKTELNPATGTLVTSEIPLEEIAVWQSGIFHFESAPLSEVFSEMERQFEIDVRTSREIEDKVYTGSFEIGNLDSALYAVTWPMRLTSEIRGRIVQIDSGNPQ